MKRLLSSLVLLLLMAAPALAAEDIVVGVTPFPHKDIMLVAKPLLAKEGYNLVLKDFTDYVQPNMALAGKQLFANFFQHQPYLDNMNKEKNLGLVSIAKVHIEPLGIYSKKIKKLDQIKKGDIISVPNDPTNEARALRLLETKGLIGIKPGALVTVADITKNPLSLKIHELDAAQLPRTHQHQFCGRGRPHPGSGRSGHGGQRIPLRQHHCGARRRQGQPQGQGPGQGRAVSGSEGIHR